MSSSEWTVRRQEAEIRVDVIDSASFEQADAQAIMDAVERDLATDGVRSVRLDGPVLEASRVSKRMGWLIRDLAGLVEARGLRFHVGPI